MCDGVTAYKLTASEVVQVKNMKNTHDGPVGFWLGLVTASWLAVRSEEYGVMTSAKAITEP